MGSSRECRPVRKPLPSPRPQLRSQQGRAHRQPRAAGARVLCAPDRPSKLGAVGSARTLYPAHVCARNAWGRRPGPAQVGCQSAQMQGPLSAGPALAPGSLPRGQEASSGLQGRIHPQTRAALHAQPPRALVRGADCRERSPDLSPGFPEGLGWEPLGRDSVTSASTAFPPHATGRPS